MSADNNHISYTIEEIANQLRVSKLTVYDLVKKGDLPVFKVGRQMRITSEDLNQYIRNHRSGGEQRRSQPINEPVASEKADSPIIISGQDAILEILGAHIERRSPIKTLRTSMGSLNGLISMYQNKCEIVSLHLFDGETRTYNVPYVCRILVGQPYIIIHLIQRNAGFYVKQGNPLHIQNWNDLVNPSVKIVNRERGSGARVLLDEQLRLNKISPDMINGYGDIETSHLSVASSVASGRAHVGVGIEKTAKLAGVEFIPMIKEQYDIVILKNEKTAPLIKTIQTILKDQHFLTEIRGLGDYDLSRTGDTIHET